MMNQLPLHEVSAGNIPVLVMDPLVEPRDEVVIFYHGWSSRSSLQVSRAIILAAYGFRVLIPEAVNHGERGELSDYYAPSSYDKFWETIIQNVSEFPVMKKMADNYSSRPPFVMGHSMGGITVNGIGSMWGRDVKGVISMNGSGDWGLTHIFLEARFGADLNNFWHLKKKVEELSPALHMENAKDTAYLFLNGEADTSVDPRAQEGFAEKLKKAGADIRSVTYKGLGHFVTTNMMDEAVSWMIHKDEEKSW